MAFSRNQVCTEGFAGGVVPSSLQRSLAPMAFDTRCDDPLAVGRGFPLRREISSHGEVTAAMSQGSPGKSVIGKWTSNLVFGCIISVLFSITKYKYL
jgi:hypothetical protein